MSSTLPDLEQTATYAETFQHCHPKFSKNQKDL